MKNRSLLLGVAAIGLAGVVGAQDKPADSLEEVVVTGSKIRGAAPVGSTVSTIDRESIDLAAPPTADRLLRQLPQVSSIGATEGVTAGSSFDPAGNRSYGNGVNLRSLGQDATLTMLNGHRVAKSGTFSNFTDLSIVPTIAIGRLETVADGASAIYGSDAIGGVVNVILREDFDGVRVALRGGTGDGVNDWAASGLFGKKWGSGSVMVAVERSYRSNLAAADRDYAVQDMRPFGGADYRTNLSSPGNIVSVGTGPGAIPVVFAIPAGGATNASQLLPGVRNLQDANYLTDLMPEQKRSNFITAWKQEIGDKLTLRGDAFYSQRDFDMRPTGASTGTIAIPSTNPYYVNPIPGSTADVNVAYSFVDDLGPRNDIGYSKDWGLAAGGEYKLTDNWRLSATAYGSKNRTLRNQNNTTNTPGLTAARTGTTAATALNVFGRALTSKTIIDRIRAYSDTNPSYTVYGVDAQIDGALFHLPGGEVRAALGVNYMHEGVTLKNYDTLTGAFQVTATDGAERNDKAVFAEVLIPFYGPDNATTLAKKLTLSLAGRAEQFSTKVGSTQNPKVGIVWSPIEELDLRASYGTSFKAPSIAYTMPQFVSLIQTGLITDPTAGNANVTRLLRTGGNPDLVPEEATTRSYGLDWRPSFLDGVKLSSTYYTVSYSNRLGQPTIDLNRLDIYGSLITTNPSQAVVDQYIAGTFGRFIGVPPLAGSVKYIFDTRFKNLGGLETSGVDVSLTYDFDTSVGTFRVATSATHILKFENQTVIGLPFQERVDTVGWPTKLRARGDISWRQGPWSASFGLQHVGGYINDTVARRPHVDSWTGADMSLGYATSDAWPKVLQKMNLQFTAENLFDKDPPFVENVTGSTGLFGFDPVAVSPLGRVIALRVSKDF